MVLPSFTSGRENAGIFDVACSGQVEKKIPINKTIIARGRVEREFFIGADSWNFFENVTRYNTPGRQNIHFI